MGILTLGHDFSPINEAYYGKPKEFLLIEAELEKIIKLLKENIDVDCFKPIKIVDLNSLDSVILIEKLFKKFFGFNNFYLSFYYPIDGVAFTPTNNAFTRPVFYPFFNNKNKDGSMDTHDLNVNVNMDVLFIVFNDLTAKEVLAFILHEIGHNMDTSILFSLSSLPISYNGYLNAIKEEKDYFGGVVWQVLFQSIEAIFKSNSAMTSVITAIESFLSNRFPGLLKFTTSFWLSINKITDLFNIPAAYFMYTNPNLYLTKMINKIFSFNNIFGYSGEKYADSFASLYGYGADLASGENKMSLKNNSIAAKTIQNVPVLNWGFDLIGVILTLYVHISDPHPLPAVRINSQLTKLKNDLKNPDLNPRLKKELESNIHELENFINNTYLNINENENKKKIFSYLFNLVIIKLFNGKVDFRELFDIFEKHEA